MFFHLSRGVLSRPNSFRNSTKRLLLLLSLKRLYLSLETVENISRKIPENEESRCMSRFAQV